jgi:uncharacterized membrane protein (TIGR02234 family)
MTTSRERLAVLALGVIGAGLAFLTVTRPWLTVSVQDPLTGSGRLHPAGRDVAALVPAAALVALAASAAAVTMRRIGRQVAGLLLVAAGAAIASAAATVLADPRAAAAESARTATGRTGDLSGITATAGVWPWLAIGAGVPIVLAGALTIVRGRRWSGLSARYDAPGPAEGGTGAPPDPADPVDPAADPAQAWDALSRGDDPTR